jgi:hypothetical protein
VYRRLRILSECIFGSNPQGVRHAAGATVMNGRNSQPCAGMGSRYSKVIATSTRPMFRLQSCRRMRMKTFPIVSGTHRFNAGTYRAPHRRLRHSKEYTRVRMEIRLLAPGGWWDF